MQVARVGDPLEDLLSLASDMKSKLRRIDMVVFFGFFVGAAVGGALLIVGIYGVIYNGIDTPFLLALIAGPLCLVVAIVSNQLEDFFLYFRNRLETLERFVEYDPRPLGPSPGTTSLDRVLAWLRKKDSGFLDLCEKHPELLRFGVSPPGMHSSWKLDAYLIHKPFLSSRKHLFLVKVFPGRITIDDLQGFKVQIENLLRRVRVAPSRILALQAEPADLPEDILSWVYDNWILYPVGKAPGKEYHACPVEVLVERNRGYFEEAIIYVG